MQERIQGNRLGAETSPYLLQHKDNPVHWRPWGEAALAEARATAKPILLSVGYAACHWCHVMAHESFEDEATAAVMNDLFVNIKVDREERPDVDAIYMGALHELGEQGGWPLTMFLTSDAEPFWGGTYFPKDARFGRPEFVRVLTAVARIYREEHDKVRQNADVLKERLKPSRRSAAAEPPSEAMLADLGRRLMQAVDPVNGGITGAPKFPQTQFFGFLWRAGLRYGLANPREAVDLTLTHIAQGGIYDHLGGGFSRYSVDARWLVPHFEKMLYDNALLIELMTEAWREQKSPLYAQRIAETIDWLLREMVTSGGGFAASLDADSEGEEGKFYVWSLAEIEDVLGSDDARAFAEIYDVTPDGNFEGHTILNRLNAIELRDEETEARLAAMRARLFERRATRVRPGFDDKVLADWNGLMIAALANAAEAFGKPEWLAAAEAAFNFVSTKMTSHGRLFHAYRAGKAKAPATANDYANMIKAALALANVTGKRDYIERASEWADVLDRHYWASDPVAGDLGGYYFVADDTNDLIAPALIVLIVPEGGDARGLRRALSDVSLPGAVVQEVREGDSLVSTLPPSSPAHGKTAIDGKPTAYVCIGPQCSLPVTEPAALVETVRAARQVSVA
ncbi:MAG: thioredoxin domain-containing protein [Methyloceanibacter sp.]